MNSFNSTLYSLLGRKIRELRIEKGLNQTQLSNKIENIGRTSISNIEKGKQQPPLHIIYLICRELDIDIHSLLPTYSEIIKEIESKKSDNDLTSFINKDEYKSSTIETIKELLKTKQK